MSDNEVSLVSPWPCNWLMCVDWRGLFPIGGKQGT